ncbi:MAG: TonB-dependent receptor [Blastomonas sp.]
MAQASREQREETCAGIEDICNPGYRADDADDMLPEPVGIEIVVAGQALPEPMGDKAYSHIDVPIGAGAGERLENSLRNVPGLQQFRRSDARSANPTSQGVTLRGLGGNASSRALLLLDGVPQSDPFGGWISWPGYDVLNLGRMTVRRGGGAGAEGPGALAGSIDMSSAPVRPGQHLVFGDVAYGSRNSLDVLIGTKQALGQGGLTLTGSYARGDGFVPILRGQRGMADRRAGYEQAALAARMVAPISGTVELQGNIRAFTDRRDRGFDFSDNRNQGADASIRLVGRGKWQWSALAYLQQRDYRNSFGSLANDRNSVSQVLDQYSVPSTGLGAQFELRPPLGEAAELRLGMDWRRTVGENREAYLFQNGVAQRLREAGGTGETLGAFAELSWQAAYNLLITGGARADHWSLDRGRLFETNIGGPDITDLSFADRSGWEGTGRIGLAWDAGSLLTLRAAGYLGWRLPTLNELYRPFRVGADATAANAALSPERLKGAEIGLDYEIYTIRLKATAFWNRLDNAIANVTLAQGPGNFPGVGFVSAAGSYSQRQNLDAVVAKGIEIDAAADIGAIGLQIGYGYVDSKVHAAPGQPGIDGLRPAQVPRHFATVAADWFPNGGDSGLALTGRYVSGQFEDDLNVQRLDDAFTLDARAAYRISDAMLIELRAENIFDARVEAAISGTGVVERAMPRTIWVGVKVDLD